MTNTPKDKTPREIAKELWISNSYCHCMDSAPCSTDKPCDYCLTIIAEIEAALAAERQKIKDIEATAISIRDLRRKDQERIKALEGALHDHDHGDHDGENYLKCCANEVLKALASPQEKKESVSICCGDSLKVVSSDEGTSYYICDNCGKPCDPTRQGNSAGPEKEDITSNAADIKRMKDGNIRKAEQAVIEAARSIMEGWSPPSTTCNDGDIDAMTDKCRVLVRALRALDRAKGKEDGHE